MHSSARISSLESQKTRLWLASRIEKRLRFTASRAGVQSEPNRIAPFLGAQDCRKNGTASSRLFAALVPPVCAPKEDCQPRQLWQRRERESEFAGADGWPMTCKFAGKSTPTNWRNNGRLWRALHILRSKAHTLLLLLQKLASRGLCEQVSAGR